MCYIVEFLVLIICCQSFLKSLTSQAALSGKSGNASHNVDYALAYGTMFTKCIKWMGGLPLPHYETDFDKDIVGYYGHVQFFNGLMSSDMGNVSCEIANGRDKQVHIRFEMRCKIETVQLSYRFYVKPENKKNYATGTVRLYINNVTFSVDSYAVRAGQQCALSKTTSSTLHLTPGNYKYDVENYSTNWWRAWQNCNCEGCKVQKYIYSEMGDRNSERFRVAQLWVHHALRPFIEKEAWRMFLIRVGEGNFCDYLFSKYRV